MSLFAPNDPDQTIASLDLDFTTINEGTLRIRHLSSSNFERSSGWQTLDGGETWIRVEKAAFALSSSGEPDQVSAASNTALLANGQDG